MRDALQAVTEAVKARASADAFVLPSLSLACLSVMTAAAFIADTYLWPGAYVVVDRLLSLYRTAPAYRLFEGASPAGKAAADVVKNHVAYAIKATTTWQVMLGGHAEDGSRVWTDDEKAELLKRIQQYALHSCICCRA